MTSTVLHIASPYSTSSPVSEAKRSYSAQDDHASAQGSQADGRAVDSTAVIGTGGADQFQALVPPATRDLTIAGGAAGNGYGNASLAAVRAEYDANSGQDEPESAASSEFIAGQ